MDLLRKFGKHVEDLIAENAAAAKQAGNQASSKSVVVPTPSAPAATPAAVPASISTVVPSVSAVAASHESPLKAEQKREGVMCTKKCQNLSCPRKHPPCLNFDNCRVKSTCPYLHSDGTRVPPVLSAAPSPVGVTCSKKCPNLSCPKNHPPCRNFENCPTKASCPFLHSDGSRVPPSGSKADDEEEAAGPEVDPAVRLHVADASAGDGKASRRQRKADKAASSGLQVESKANEKGDKPNVKAKDIQRSYNVVADLVSVFGNKLSGDARLPLVELDRLCQLHYADNAPHMRLPFPDFGSLLPLLPLDEKLKLETDVCIFSSPLPACPDLFATGKCLKQGCILQHKCPFTNKACPRGEECKLMHRQVRVGEGQKLAVEIVSLYGTSSGPLRSMPLSKFEELLRILPEKAAGSLPRGSSPELLEQILRPGVLTLNDGVLTAHSPVDACRPNQSNLPCAQTPCPLRHQCLFPRETCPVSGCGMAHKSKDAKNAQLQKLVCEVISLYGNVVGSVRTLPVAALDNLLRRLPAKVTGRLLKSPIASLLPRIVRPKVLEAQDGVVICFSPVSSCMSIRSQRSCTQVACPFRHKCMFPPQACPLNQSCGMLHKTTPPEGKPKEKGEGKRQTDKESKPFKDREGKPPKDREGKPPKDKEGKPPKDREGKPPKDKEAKPPKDREGKPLKDKEGKPPKEKAQGEKKEGPRNERPRHPETHESVNRAPSQQQQGAPIKIAPVYDAVQAQRAPRPQRLPNDNTPSAQQAAPARVQKAPTSGEPDLKQWLQRKDLLDLWPHLMNTFDSVRTCQLAFKGLQAKEIRDELGLHGMSGLATAAKLREALDT